MNGLPKIAIVGRPNVGKSSIYNRIIGKRESIIDPTPGVTRNRHYHLAQYNSKNFLIIDTGGITIEVEEDDFATAIKIQSEIAIAEADLILFVVDVAGFTADDHMISEILRKSGKEVILLVNKCDNMKLEYSSVDAYELNLGEPLAISASHGINFDVLLDEITFRIPEVKLEEEGEQKINVVLVGRPNVGKSTLLNKFVGWERSMVSEIPGTTRDAIQESFSYKDYQINFLDTAGIRRKGKVHDNVEYYSVNRAVKSIEKSDVAIHLIDSLDNISDQDKKIINIAVTRGKAIIMAVNKWDLLTEEADFKKYVDYLRFRFAVGNYIPIINISAKTGKKVNKLLDMVIDLYKQHNLRIDTNILNDLLQKAQEKYLPSTRKGRLKIYYGTQISASPPKFLLFVNRKDLFTKNYQTYLTNQFRQTFGFEGVPIFIYTRKHH